MIARSTPWGTIQLGDEFFKLPLEEKFAVLAHEEGHIKHLHAWKRIWWVITFRAFFDPEGFFYLCERQEFEADKHAADCGHAQGLIALLRRFDQNVQCDGYPSPARRIGAIRG